MNLIIGRALWIDVCQSNGNLLVSGGWDKIIKIFDKRESKIVKTFEGVHSSKELHPIFCFHPLPRFCLLFNLFKLFLHASHFNYRFENILDFIYCVHWNPSGDMIASASGDGKAKLLDFKTGKVLHTGTTSDRSKYLLTNIN
jgi:WD40 repeat protein